MFIIVTNNSLVKEQYAGKKGNLRIEYLENATSIEVLIRVRDCIHLGKRLETHPMAGSIKPNQNPYKSVMISDQTSDPEEFKEFITVLENGIMVFKDFLARRALPDWPEALLEDFRFVDMSLIDSAVERI